MGKGAQGGGTVGKALSVLDQVAAFARPVRFSELLATSEYPKATLYRLLQSLTRQGMLSHEPDAGTYALGVRLVRLAHAAWRQSSLAPVARSHIDTLAKTTGVTVHLAQLDNAQVLYVDKCNVAEPTQMYAQAGKVGPVYCTGIGKAMLAWLPEREQGDVIDQQSFHRFTPTTLTDETQLRREIAATRLRGYATDNEEHEPGIICIARPILSRSGRVLGGLSLASETAQHALASLAALVPVLKTTANRIAEDAESWRFPDMMNQHA